MIFSELGNIEKENRNNPKVVLLLFGSLNRLKKSFYSVGVSDVLMEFFPHAEGYVNVTTRSNGNRIYNYVYNYTDHLDERNQSIALVEVCERSSVRMTYTKDDIFNELKILEENHYYPFGLKHTLYTGGELMNFKEVEDMEDVATPPLPPDCIGWVICKNAMAVI